MSQFQDDQDGNDITGLSRAETDDEAIELFIVDAELELSNMIDGLSAEFNDPKTRPGCLLENDAGSIAHTYMGFWLDRLQEDQGQTLEPKTTLGELLLFIALKQAEMDILTSGKRS